MYPCLVCGDPVAHHGEWRPWRNVAWTAEFRVVTAAIKGVYEPRLSGVGVYDSTGHKIPPSYETRWDDASFQFPDRTWVSARDRHSFALHDNCCALLQQFFHPGLLPVSRLHQACLSCVAQYGRDYLSWGPGHDYGGIINVSSRFPWAEANDCYLPLRSARRNPRDPWDISEVNGYLERSQLDASTPARRKGPKRAWARKPPAKRVRLGGNTTSNIFTELPLEMLEYILTFLPTDVVKNLARISKAIKMIIPSCLGPTFWASRFQVPFECAFVFEALVYKGPLNWKSLYFTIQNSSSRRLKNRRRIWSLIQSLSEILELKWNQVLLPLTQEKEERRWKRVHRIWHGHSTSQVSTVRTSIPALLRHIRVSIVSAGNATYVAGIRFISNEEKNVCVGYTNGAESCLETTEIYGFVVAVGSRGIHALRVVTPTGQLSQWFGDPNGVPKTRRLMTCQPITALEASFDGFKMVSIAIPAAQSPPLREPQINSISLRESALWYPDIPKGCLELNEAWFEEQDQCDAAFGFRPLCCILSDTTNAASVSKIVVVQDDNRTPPPIVAVGCHYDTGDVQELALSNQAISFARVSRYLIDRTAGEVADTITFVKEPDPLE